MMTQADVSPVAAQRPARPALRRAFDAVAMAGVPLVARLRGLRFRVGTDAALARDGHAVHAAVWADKGVPEPPADLMSIADRYDRATATWIVAYHRGRPVGVMALLDMRVASVTLDFEAAAAPRDLDLARTLEIARLAIADDHRGGAQLVMVGLLREMLAFCRRRGTERLFAGSTASLYRVFRAFNPSARLARLEPRDDEPADLACYYAPLRRYAADAGRKVAFTFDVDGASPWAVFSTLVKRLLRGRARQRRD